MNSSKDTQLDVFSEYGLSTDDQRSKLNMWGKILIYFGWIATALTAIAIIVLTIKFSSNFNWALFGILMGTLIISQGTRIAGRMLKKKSEHEIPFSEKKISHIQTQREREVREYFNKNTSIAAKFIQMKSLAQQGRYKDAYNVASSLLKLNLPHPIQEFLVSKKNQYAKLRKK